MVTKTHVLSILVMITRIPALYDSLDWMTPFNLTKTNVRRWMGVTSPRTSDSNPKVVSTKLTS